MPCTTVQATKEGTKPSSWKALPRKVPVQDASIPSEPVATGLHFESQVDRNSHNALILKTNPVHAENIKCGLRAK